MGSYVWNVNLKNGATLEVIADRCNTDESGARFYRNDKDSAPLGWDDHLVGFIPMDRIFSIVIVGEGCIFQEVDEVE